MTEMMKWTPFGICLHSCYTKGNGHIQGNDMELSQSESSERGPDA